MGVYINEIATYLPPRIISNQEIEEISTLRGKPIPNGMLEKLFGCKHRRRATPNEQVSDIAVKAVQNLKAVPKSIDLLIFASASSDLIEPATGNIVQSKLDLDCAVIDIKNACNSFTSAMIMATNSISCRQYKNVLIVNGEKLHEVINFNPVDASQFNNTISGLTLGDGGCAMVLSNIPKGIKILNHQMKNWGKHWELCTIKGGGSMHYRDVSKSYFEVDAIKLKNTMRLIGYDYVFAQLKAWNIPVDTLEVFITHQVNSNSAYSIGKVLGFEKDNIYQRFEDFGNVAAATVPISLSEYIQSGKSYSGQKILVIGLAAGISISIHVLEVI